MGSKAGDAEEEAEPSWEGTAVVEWESTQAKARGTMFGTYTREYVERSRAVTRKDDDEELAPLITGLYPPTTVTAADHMTRADYHRWLHEENNYEAANETRAERQDRRRFRGQQEAAAKRYGKELAEQRKLQQVANSASREEVREQAAAVAADMRLDNEAMRAERQAQQKDWQAHGRQLREQYSLSHTKAKKHEQLKTKAAVVRQIKEDISLLEQYVRDQKTDLAEERRLRAERVKVDTSDQATRMAKKLYVDDRWDVADAMREDMELWRKERNHKEMQYMARAKEIRASVSHEPARKARERVQAERAADAASVRGTRNKTVGKKEDAREKDIRHKQAMHAAVHANKFIATSEVKTTPERLKSYFSIRSPARRVKPQEVRL